jgi:protein-S-isoprenylcysteine O-methyltransferase Ste14
MTRLPGLGPRGECWVIIQAVLLAGVAVAGWASGPDWSGAARLAGIGLGIVTLAGGTLLAARGVIDLRSALTPMPRPREDAVLIESGVYALARHPIYGGLILASFGWALTRASTLALLATAALVAFFWLKSTREEAWLIERFPDYPAYRTRTRRFIPWIG